MHRNSEKQHVSPIKIRNNKVIKSSSSHKFKVENTLINSDQKLQIPILRIKNLSSSRIVSNSARRNLNISLNEIEDIDSNDDEIHKSGILNYSIIDKNDTTSNDSSNNIKIKLRKSQRMSIKNQNDENNTLKNEIIDKINSITKKRFYSNDNDSKLDFNLSPSKRNKQLICNSVSKDESSKRKSILKTTKTIQELNNDTPRKRVQLIGVDNTLINNKENKKHQIDDSNKNRKSTRTSGQNIPSVHDKNDNEIVDVKKDKSSKKCISLSTESLPCRENEFQNIYTFLKNKICDETGGCMYISGVPGTGKTATVTSVINYLKYQSNMKILPKFNYIEINGMKLTEPRQAYVHIYKQLIYEKDNDNRKKISISWEHALSALEKNFTKSNNKSSEKLSSQKMTILLVDELDILCNRRQDVIYNLLDWPTKSNAKLIVITIANTMDLPERVLMGKVTSRLGLTRLTFLPYTHQQLQNIVTVKLMKTESFKSDAIQFIARKVAAVSGDARRALDICKRAIEICNNEFNEKNKNKISEKFNIKDDTMKIVNMLHVQQALNEMISSTKVKALKKCSNLEKIFLQAIVAEISRTGIEETTFYAVYTQMESIAIFMGISVPPIGKILRICSKLGAERLLLCEHSRTDIYQKILLNVSTDDIHYALQLKNSN